MKISKPSERLVSMKNKTILILGAGQIGEACAIRVLEEKPKRIVLHALTETEAKQVLANIKKIAAKFDVELTVSWGNALVTKSLMYVDKDKICNDKKNKKELINYYYSFFNNKLIRKSSLYHLIKRWKPDVIFDGINTATVVGYQDDPYSIPRKILSNKKSDWQDSTENLLVSNTIPSLIRFTQALKEAMADFKVNCYVKISTTGLGGMGNNLFYTHGDVNEPGMSSGILGKVAAAGVVHQLFLSLSHTPGFNIKVIVPAALVGWQRVNFGKFRSHGKNLPLMDSIKRVSLKDKEVFKTAKCQKIADHLEIPYVDSGENCAYSLGEMTAITAVGQMECVTREEVAQAAIEAAYGSTKHDLLTAIDLVSLGPSHVAAVQRDMILSKLYQLETGQKTYSIATNNLGPTVSKHLFELFLIMKVSDYSIKKCIESEVPILVKAVEKLLMKDVTIRSQIVSLGLPIIFDNNEGIIGEYYYVPNPKEENKISKENINLWASCGWVDIRKPEIEYWQSVLKRVYKEITSLEKSESVILDRNWQKAKKGDIRELLGFIYSILGGERRTRFV